ncbi:MAG: hypothetical protein A3K18_09810 [Lentisphaerae bacterium RIFOXYA12_64_32]|nr:MAG: hypothetical protein A3K18_09810 [Lentisphaerae bacterium RIFOXYA12_64_32]
MALTHMARQHSRWPSRWWRLWPLIVIVVMLIGCGRRVNYHVLRENTGAVELNDMVVSFDDFTTLPTVLPPGIRKKMLFVGDDHPLPEQAQVSWTTPQGKHVSKTVAVKSLVPPKARLVTIVFSIDAANEVHVSVKDPEGL